MVVITGGSRGIGAATARLASRNGFSVAVNYRISRDEALKVANEINEGGGRAIAIQGDVSTERDVEALFNFAETELGPVTALVNNAGVPGNRVTLDKLDVIDLRNIVDVNLIGSFLCAREAVRRMAPRGYGAIVNVSSTASQSGGGGGGIIAYAASKAGIETMTVGLAREVGPSGIRVNAVRPGAIDTEMNAFSQHPEALEYFSQTAPLRRVGKPEEVAAAILWLLSDAASFVHGAILAVSGGR
jgi:glucose 1-dehydrogenase